MDKPCYLHYNRTTAVSAIWLGQLIKVTKKLHLRREIRLTQVDHKLDDPLPYDEMSVLFAES